MTLTQRTWTGPPLVGLHYLLHQLYQPTHPQAGMALAPNSPLPVSGWPQQHGYTSGPLPWQHHGMEGPNYGQTIS